MEIGPTTNSSAAMPSLRTTRAAVPGPARHAKVDSIDISLESRARLAEMADRNQPGKIREDSVMDGHLNDIRARIENGFYDSKEARSKIIDRLMNDL